MSRIPDDRSTALYRWACWLLITTSVATMIGRILCVRASTGETPMLSANDRSRWCTIRALVDDGTYAIDPIIRQRHDETHRRFWSTIDRVRHRGPDGREHDYSSKPTLLPTLLAGQYWVIQRLTGATLAEHPFFLMRLMLVITNVLPLILYFLVLFNLLRQMAVSDAARLYIMAAATWGTFLTTFAVTLNNHLPAAISVLLATALTLSIWRDPSRPWWYFAGAGLFSAFAAANELPALSFFVAIAVAVFWQSPKRAALVFVPPALLVVAGFFGTNYLAHGTWTPAYAHRSDGPVIGFFASPGHHDATLLDRKQIPLALRKVLGDRGVKVSDQARILVDQPGKRWQFWDRNTVQRFALVLEGEAEAIEVRQWNNWYDYQGSYWRNQKQGVDRGETSRWKYALHVIAGHHGIFSLTPLWLLSVAGVVIMLRDRRRFWWQFAVMVTGLTVVCLAFYLARPVEDRNYGGMTSAFRWMFWFIPLWLLCAIPAVDRLLRTGWGRWIALLLLLISGVSAAYPLTNPWSHPWLFDLGTTLGWWKY